MPFFGNSPAVHEFGIFGSDGYIYQVHAGVASGQILRDVWVDTYDAAGVLLGSVRVYSSPVGTISNVAIGAVDGEADAAGMFQLVVSSSDGSGDRVDSLALQATDYIVRGASYSFGASNDASLQGTDSIAWDNGWLYTFASGANGTLKITDGVNTFDTQRTAGDAAIAVVPGVSSAPSRHVTVFEDETPGAPGNVLKYVVGNGAPGAGLVVRDLIVGTHDDSAGVNFQLEAFGQGVLLSREVNDSIILDYYRQNADGTLTLIDSEETKFDKFVFDSRSGKAYGLWGEFFGPPDGMIYRHVLTEITLGPSGQILGPEQAEVASWSVDHIDVSFTDDGRTVVSSTVGNTTSHSATDSHVGAYIDTVVTGSFFGSALADTLVVEGQDARIYGGGGADRITIRPADNQYVNGGGYEGNWVIFDTTSDVFLRANGAWTTDTGSGVVSNFQNIVSGSGNDILYGSNLWSESIDGGLGADTMRGGLGHERYVVDNVGDVIVEYADQGTDSVQSTVSYTLSSNVENLTLLGSQAINATGNAAANILTGNAAANVLNGAAGADTASGLGGDDLYYVDAAGDRVIEAAGGGSDRVAAFVSYALQAGQEIELLQTTASSGTAAINLTGNAFAQTILGNAGANRLNGGQGADTLIGLGADDIYYVDNAGDRVIEAANGGYDHVASTVDYILQAGQSVEFLSTSATASTAAISLTGNEVRQLVLGNAGNNVLNGKGGADILTGLGGTDTFVFDTALGGGNVDHITDYTSSVRTLHDTIRLDKTVFSALNLGAFDAAAYKDIGDPGAVVDASDRILYNDDTGELFYDSNGSGAGGRTLFAILDNKPATLTAADFFVVA